MATHHAGQSPPMTTNNAHPPYTKMIIAAITALKDKDGSTRHAISKYIEKEFANLPPTHSTLLTNHLKRLKNLDQLVTVKHAYMLPHGSVQFQPPASTDYHPSRSSGGSDVNEAKIYTGAVNLEDPPSVLSKRKPGRPPKLKHVPGLGSHNQNMNVQEYDANPSLNFSGGSDVTQANFYTGAVNLEDPPSVLSKRKPGRPPKLKHVPGLGSHNQNMNVQEYDANPSLNFSGGSDVTQANFYTGAVNLEDPPSVLSKRKPGRPPKLKPVPGLGLHNQNMNVQAYDANPSLNFSGGSDVTQANFYTGGVNLEDPPSGLSKRKPGRLPKPKPVPGLGLHNQNMNVQAYDANPSLNFSGGSDVTQANFYTGGVNLEDPPSGLSKRKPGRPPKPKPVPGLALHNQNTNVQAYDANPSLNFSGGGDVTRERFYTGGVNLEDPPSGLSKRKPGRPPKLKSVPGLGLHNQNMNEQAYDANFVSYESQFQYHGGAGQDLDAKHESGSEPLFASLGLGDEGVVPPSPSTENSHVVVKRGRGRPPKSSGGKAAASGGHVASSGGGHVATSGVGHVAGSDGGGGELQAVEAGSVPVRKMEGDGVKVKRGRGRQRRCGIGPVTVPLSGNLLRPRGRPKKVTTPNVAVVNGGTGECVSGLRRSSRPSRNTGGNLTGEPLGRPVRGGLRTAVIVTDPQQLVVYQELKSK